jgi:hypothetical protein
VLQHGRVIAALGVTGNKPSTPPVA